MVASEPAACAGDSAMSDRCGHFVCRTAVGGGPFPRGFISAAELTRRFERLFLDRRRLARLSTTTEWQRRPRDSGDGIQDQSTTRAFGLLWAVLARTPHRPHDTAAGRRTVVAQGHRPTQVHDRGGDWRSRRGLARGRRRDRGPAPACASGSTTRLIAASLELGPHPTGDGTDPAPHDRRRGPVVVARSVRSRSQSKAAPGSVLRPGATSEWPTTRSGERAG